MNDKAMSDVVGDALVDSKTLAGWFTAWGSPIRQSTMRVWVARGRLTVHGRTHDGLNLYRFSEMNELVNARDAKLRNRVCADSETPPP